LVAFRWIQRDVLVCGQSLLKVRPTELVQVDDRPVSLFYRERTYLPYIEKNSASVEAPGAYRSYFPRGIGELWYTHVKYPEVSLAGVTADVVF